MSKPDELSAADVDRIHTETSMQIMRGTLCLWSALADAAICAGADPEALLALISYGTTKDDKEQSGGALYRAMTRAAMKSTAQARWGSVEAAPEWAQRAISGEEPVRKISFQKGAR